MGAPDITSYPTPSKLGLWGSTLVGKWMIPHLTDFMDLGEK